ncbi:hypothetical protein JE034_09595 [Achromobacter xylosoxidans]|uniref:hypothetical protein n=1 Tax=Alcaligenes xylosoxydans xylosoxydans TaxID=85698 RepID=UPI001905B5E5|nr:hypothetical protein [Achromobacter xylosoxidans]MBK1979110.1 hypothetical protein [Achromobacter xylosoxidans]
MTEKFSSEFLQGQIIGLAYALRSVIDHHPNSDTVLGEIQHILEGTSNSMLEGGTKQAADGVERIRMALGTTAKTDD